MNADYSIAPLAPFFNPCVSGVIRESVSNSFEFRVLRAGVLLLAGGDAGPTAGKTKRSAPDAWGPSVR